MQPVVCITGASKGIGAELALLCAKLGFNLVLVARSAEALEAVVSKCNEAGGHAIAVFGDVTKKATFEAALEAGINKFGRVHVLVNNAGQGISKNVLDLSEEDVDEMFAINTKSVLLGMQVFTRHFQQQPRPTGQVINVSSMLGRVPSAPQRSAYSAAKHAVNSLTANLRMNMMDQGYSGILICGFHPGVVGTEFGLNSRHGGVDNRLLPDVQPVSEVADVMLSQIQQGLAAMKREEQHIVTPVQQEDGTYEGAARFEEHDSFFDVYSRPSYKQDVINYFSADSLGAYERKKRALYKDAFLAAAAKRAQQQQ